MIDKIDELYNIGFIHREITPATIVNSSNNKDNLILIDYGVSSGYLTNDNTHIKFKEEFGIIGTQYFSSINSNKWNTQSRRDDLEGLFYCLHYFFNDGYFPWDSFIVSKDENKFSYINSKIS